MIEKGAIRRLKLRLYRTRVHGLAGLSGKAQSNQTSAKRYAQGDFLIPVPVVPICRFLEIAALMKLTAFRQDHWGHDRVLGGIQSPARPLPKCSQPLCSPFTMISLARRHIADYTAQHVSVCIAERCLWRATEMVTLLEYWKCHENTLLALREMPRASRPWQVFF